MRPGLEVMLADLFAQNSMRDEYVKQLEVVTRQDRYAEWAWHDFIEAQRADPDRLLNKYASFGENEVEACVGDAARAISLRVSGSGVLAFSVEGRRHVVDQASVEACFERAVAPVAALLPGKMAVTWRFDLEAPQSNGPPPPLTATSRSQWLATQEGALSPCFTALRLRAGSVLLSLSFEKKGRLKILEVRDAAGIPVDGRRRAEREAFGACLQQLLGPTSWPGIPAEAESLIEARITYRPGKVSWTELSKSAWPKEIPDPKPNLALPVELR